MSCFVVGQKTLNNIYSGLSEYIFKNNFLVQEIRETLEKGYFNVENAEDLTILFYKLNEIAYSSRYKEKIFFEGKKFELSNISLEQFFKSLDCLFYQCDQENLLIENFNYVLEVLKKIFEHTAIELSRKVCKAIKGWGD